MRQIKNKYEVIYDSKRFRVSTVLEDIPLNENQILINCKSKKERDFIEKEIIKLLIQYRNKDK